MSAGKNTPAAARAVANATDAAVMLPRIESRILVVREHKVIVDADLALLYGVPTKALNQAVKRNADRFPMDFMFQLSAAEKAEVVTACDHLQKLKFSKSLPYAFTEHGAIQAANVLASPRAVEIAQANEPRCATVGGSNQPGGDPVRRRGRAFTRFATSIAQCAAHIVHQPAFMLGGDVLES